MKTHEVGDILWVVGKERPGVRVFRVIEEVTKKSLDGIVTSYRVQSPSNKSSVISLEKIDGEIYANSGTAQTAMNKKAALAINSMVVRNQKLIDKFWSEENQKPTPTTKAGKLKPIPEITSENFIELPDGTKARLNIPNIEDII